MSPNPDELLNSAMAGEKAALQALLMENFDTLADRLRTRIPASLQNTISVEDVLQITFMRVFCDIGEFHGSSIPEFRAWLRTIADARLHDVIRGATRQKRGGRHRRVSDTAVSPKRTPSQSAATHEAVDALLDAIADLAPDQREVIRLRYIEHLSLAEVASRVGRSEDAVRGLIHRSKGALRKIMGNSSAWFSRIG